MSQSGVTAPMNGGAIHLSLQGKAGWAKALSRVCSLNISCAAAMASDAWTRTP